MLGTRLHLKQGWPSESIRDSRRGLLYIRRDLLHAAPLANSELSTVLTLMVESAFNTFDQSHMGLQVVALL